MRHVLRFNEHTWGAQRSITEPNHPSVPEQWRIKHGYAATADTLSRDLLMRAAASGSAGDYVFNVAQASPPASSGTVPVLRTRGSIGSEALPKSAAQAAALRTPMGRPSSMARRWTTGSFGSRLIRRPATLSNCGRKESPRTSPTRRREKR